MLTPSFFEPGFFGPVALGGAFLASVGFDTAFLGAGFVTAGFFETGGRELEDRVREVLDLEGGLGIGLGAAARVNPRKPADEGKS